MFTGDPENPRFDVTLIYRNDQEEVTVWVTLGGSLKELDVAFRSEPTLDEASIMTLLITGSLPDGSAGQSPSAGAQAGSLVGGYLASQLQRTLLKNVPIDVLTVSMEAVEAGTYITEKLYVGYVRRLQANPWRYENLNAAHLEYQFTPRWSFEGEYGDAGTASADIYWRRRY